MNKTLTVSRSIYALLKKHGGKANKGEILEWSVPYDEGGKRKYANKDTVARKLREMAEEGEWIGREERNHQAFYWAITDTPPKEPPKVEKPVPMQLGGNRPVAVPVDKVEQALALGYKKI